MKTLYRKVFALSLVVSLMVFELLTFLRNETYKSIKIKSIKNTVVEYGSSNVDVNKFIKEIDGKVISIKKDIDTSKVGKQEIILEVEKNSVIKNVPIVVSVKDTIAPVITLKEDNITINQGDNINLLDNISSVNDLVDGDLFYQELDDNNDSFGNNYYTISGNVDTNTAGDYKISVRAVDNFGNESLKDFLITVKAKEVVPVVNNNINYSINFDASKLVNTAYSLVGSRYVAGGNNPATGFDCSGFVQYLYSTVDISISRSTTTQINDGVAVSYENAIPGDILCWGFVDGVPTHSALYVGNGLMIHAANPVQGVLVSDVAAWTRGSGSRVIAVRRII